MRSDQQRTMIALQERIRQLIVFVKQTLVCASELEEKRVEPRCRRQRLAGGNPYPAPAAARRFVRGTSERHEAPDTAPD